MEETGARRERTTPSCLRGKGVLRQICRSPSSASPPDRSRPRRRYFFLRRTRKHDKRAIDPKTLYGENGSETRNTDGNLHL